MRNIFILGSTGSIGTQALQVVDKHRDRLRVKALTAASSVLSLARQVAIYHPTYVGLSNPELVSEFWDCYQVQLKILTEKKKAGGNIDSWECRDLHYHPKLIVGNDASAKIAAMAVSEDTVLNGITGGIGLSSTLAALESGATLALANKESLVIGGAVVRQAMCRPAQIVPVDSEHSAIAQALSSGQHHRGLTVPNVDGSSEVSQLILTASGGPFRGKKRKDMENVTVKQALAHPTWNMGPVVTINSSTLMNKALELIEAHLLFDIPAADIIPVVHPQSLIHSAVTWQDGSTIAQISPPDMALPIALGIAWPQRLKAVAKPMDWSQPQSWDFEPVDYETFPALSLARMALEESDTHPAVLNAANEVFVDAFIAGQLPYLGIVDSVATVLEAHRGIKNPSLEAILETEEWARYQALEIVENSGK